MMDALKGKRIWIYSLGCRSNQYEGEAVANALTEAGAVPADSPEGTDGAVIISCTVTAEADRKCRQAVRKAKRMSRNSIIAASGCWAQKITAEEAKSLGIRIVAGNRRKSRIPEMLARAFEEASPEYSEDRVDVMHCREWDPLFLNRPLLHTRAFIKVQDGCNHFCSYCVIPFVRGFPVSRDPGDVVREVESIAGAGCREVVLTGVHLGLYGKYGTGSLASLVRKVAAVEGISRIRFGSLEPFGLDEELLETLAGTPQFCRHLHLPLQSGSARILSRMRRGYSPEDFLSLAEKARTYLGDDLHISTDILVGFPGEEDLDFGETLALMKECRFGKSHVFPFSPREGTDAFSLPGRVPRETVSERARAAGELAGLLLQEYSRRWTGREVLVLAEEVTGNTFSGLSPSFLRVVSSGTARKGQEQMVRITKSCGDTLRGRKTG